MTEYVQDRRQRRRGSDDPQAQPADLRNRELDEDVACCLDEIDDVLDREQAERDQARAEFEKFGRDTRDRELNLWQAKYAHLGLKYGRTCCGTPYMLDPKDKM